MATRRSDKNKDGSNSRSAAMVEKSYHGRIFSAPNQDKFLDSVQLSQLERSFRDWAATASRADVRSARLRILLIFLLIRYTGAKLSEVLNLDPVQDIDYENHYVLFGRNRDETEPSGRKVQLPGALCTEIRTIIEGSLIKKEIPRLLGADPGFVRRKFYERAEACGIAKQLGAPEILRKSRAVELMQNNLPLPAVQMLLGHSTPNLTSAYVSFSEDDIQHVTKIYMEKESTRKTSARNNFFGKIRQIRHGDIQTRVELITTEGHTITTIITNDSFHRLCLKTGMLITAEVKAPWVLLQKSGIEAHSSADNMFKGVVARITRGKINTEYTVRISDDTEVCAIVTSESDRRLALTQGDDVWVLFSSYSVVLRSD